MSGIEAGPSGRKTPSGPRKVRRISMACDFCHQRSIRCRVNEEEDSKRCQNCVDFKQTCTFDRPQKRSKRQDLPTNTINEGHTSILEYQRLIDTLVDVYYEIVYPLYPFHHRATFTARLAAKEHYNNRAFFANLMAMCALSASRLRDGASPCTVRTDPVRFAKAARESFPKELTSARGLDYMRACALMTVYKLQDGQRDEMQEYLGMYLSIVTMDGLSDENKWPKDSTYVEIEERRRLFWSMYCLEAFTSTVWGSFIRLREAQCKVSYPLEVDDEDIGVVAPDRECWLHGWNFTTELYRVLEHIRDAYPENRQSQGLSVVNLFAKNSPPQESVLQELLLMHDRLPQRFKEMQHSTDLSDKFNFQAANIAATFQLVRIVLCTTHKANFASKVQSCNEFLNSFYKVPPIFLKAISSPLLYHLAGIGSILGSVIEGPVTYEAYFEVRKTLLAMADLLDVLEIGHTHAIGSSEPLRSHINRMDEFMNRTVPYAHQLPSHPAPSNSYSLGSSSHSLVSQAPQPGQSQGPLVAPPAEGYPSSQPDLLKFNLSRSGGPISGASSSNASSSEPIRSYGLASAASPSGGPTSPTEAIGLEGGVRRAPGPAPLLRTGPVPLVNAADLPGGVSSTAGGSEVQIPPELLEDMPWPFTFAEGFGL